LIKLREYLFLVLAIFALGIASKKGASFFKILCFCRLQVLNTKNDYSEKSKKVKDYSKRVEQNHVE